MHGMDMSTMTHYDEGVWVEREFVVPEDVWLTEFSTDFSGISAHNFYLFIKGTRDEWCPENPTAIYSGGTVSAKRPLTFNPPFGVFIKKGTTLVLKALYMAPAGDLPESNISFSVHAEYEPATSSLRTVPIFLHFITPGPCAYTRPIFTVPAYANNAIFSSAEKPFIFSDDGHILKAMAHFHASYEKGIVNTVNIFMNGKMLDSFTTTDVGNDAERNPQLLTDELVRVNGGDILTMQAIFSNPRGTPVAEGMAIFGFYFAPQKQ